MTGLSTRLSLRVTMHCGRLSQVGVPDIQPVVFCQTHLSLRVKPNDVDSFAVAKVTEKKPASRMELSHVLDDLYIGRHPNL